MRLIIEKSHNRAYAYREDESVFQRMEKDRCQTLDKLRVDRLDKECDLTDLPNNTYIVLQLKTSKPKKKTKKKFRAT